MTSYSRKWFFWLAVGVLFFVFLFMIRGVLLPFVLGIFIAYFLDPAADRLERWGWPRALATLFIVATFFTVLAALIVLVAPVLAEQLSGLAAALPQYISKLNQQYLPQLSYWLHDLPPQQVEEIKSAMADSSDAVFAISGNFISGFFASTMAIVATLSLILITPVVAFYLLRDWDVIVARIDKLLPRAHATTIRQQLYKVDRTLAGFLRGMLTACLIMGTYYGIGLLIVGLKFGILIGLVTGFLAIIPYVGFGLGMIVGLAVAFFQFESVEPVLMVLAVFLTGQALESYFVTPKLVGDRVGLHPLWIIFGMLVGGALGGFVGVLLAVPTTAVIGVLIRFMIEQYLQSEYYEARK